MKLTEWIENKRFAELVKVHVPHVGNAKTPYGEALRAVMRLEYEFFNNNNANAKNYIFKELYEKLVIFVNQHSSGTKALELSRCARELNPATRHHDESTFTSAVDRLKRWFVDNPGMADRYLDEL